jgi:hypothetical protein
MGFRSLSLPGQLAALAPANVLGVRDRLKVVWVHAAPDSAKVVEGHDLAGMLVIGRVNR